MPGYVIHLSIAKEYLRNFRVKDEKEFFKGVLAPDLLANKKEDKIETHYLDKAGNANINLKKFLKNNKINTSYEQGYFLHLITDFLFYTKYCPEFDKRAYNDYDKTNKTLIEKYQIEIPDEIKKEVQFKNGETEVLNLEKLYIMISEISKKSLREYKKEIKINNTITTDLENNKLITSNKRNKIEKITLSIVILMLCLVMLFFINQKKGYHWDEIFSYGSSNNKFNNMYWSYNEFDGINSLAKEKIFNTKNPLKVIINLKYYFIDHKDEKNNYEKEVLNKTNKVRWRTSKEAEKYVKAKNNRFNYYSVYYNQVQDVHPPLFYIIVHTISSIFNKSFSKYTIFFINIPFFIGTCILIWKILNLIREKNNIDFSSNIIWIKYRCNINNDVFKNVYDAYIFYNTLLVYKY